jgi:hypothetical protein
MDRARRRTGTCIVNAVLAPALPTQRRERAMTIKSTFLMGLIGLVGASAGRAAAPPEPKANSAPLNLGPVALTETTYASAATVTANALGSGVNAPGSDGSGILINVQNQGNGFLSATEFASTIVDPVRNKITHAIDVQEGVLNKKTGDFIGAVYSADTGTMGTGVLVQNSRGASWQYAFKYEKDGGVQFAVDGAGGIMGSRATIGSVALSRDSKEGSIDVGNLGNKSASPYINLNGFGKSNDVRLINDANGKFSHQSGYAREILVPVCDRSVGCRSQFRVCLRISEYLEAVELEFILTATGPHIYS